MKYNVQTALATLILILSTVLLALLVAEYMIPADSLPQVLLDVHQSLTGLFLQSLWFLPVYGFFCAFLLLITDGEHPYLVMIPFTAVLYATVILFLQTQFGPDLSALNIFISEQVGRRSASLLLLFIFVLEVVLFVIWSLNRFSTAGADRSGNYVLRRKKMRHPSHEQPAEPGSSPAPGKAERTQTQFHAPAVGEDDDHHFHELTLSFPELPELPKIAAGSGQKAQSPPRRPDASAAKTPKPRSVPPQEKKPAEPAEKKMSEPKREAAPKQVFGTVRPVELTPAQPEKRKEEVPDITEIGDSGIPAIPPESPGFINMPVKEEPSYPAQEIQQDNEQDEDEGPGYVYEAEQEPEADEFIPGVTGLPVREAADGDAARGYLRHIGYTKPPQELLDTYPDVSSEVDRATKLSGEVLMKTLREFKIDAELTGIQKGPVVTMYEILPAPGIRVQTITNLADNIALQLAASRVRMVAPIPGKQAVGIEVPNKERSIVSFKEMLAAVDSHDRYEIPVVLGKDITGESQVIDLVKTPHLLIAGATGSGKSVCVNSLICSILYRRSPNEVRLMMVDPKIVELKLYNDIPHLLTPVITDSKKAIKALQYCIHEMERRYDLLDNLNARDIKTYNRKIEEKRLAREKLPYIVLIIDEFADLMTTTGKEIESYLARLAAMARAVGIHLVLATQRPSTNVITGIIKANIPSRIAFMVASNTDSRIILDQAGAEKLLGRGDMLFSSSWDPVLQRIQGSFLSEDEVERVVGFVKEHGEPDYLDEEYFEDDEDDDDGDDFDLESDDGSDSLMEEALEIVFARKSASASYLQRRLKIGYNRAARIIEEMEDRGIIGPARGSQPREVLRTTDLD